MNPMNAIIAFSTARHNHVGVTYQCEALEKRQSSCFGYMAIVLVLQD